MLLVAVGYTLGGKGGKGGKGGRDGSDATIDTTIGDLPECASVPGNVECKNNEIKPGVK